MDLWSYTAPERVARLGGDEDGGAGWRDRHRDVGHCQIRGFESDQPALVGLEHLKAHVADEDEVALRWDLAGLESTQHGSAKTKGASAARSVGGVERGARQAIALFVCRAEKDSAGSGAGRCT